MTSGVSWHTKYVVLAAALLAGLALAAAPELLRSGAPVGAVALLMMAAKLVAIGVNATDDIECPAGGDRDV